MERITPRRVLGLRSTAALVSLIAFSAVTAAGQVPLSAVNQETTVRKISFRFVEGSSFSPNVLEQQIWHSDPGFWDRFSRIMPFVDAPEFPFSPLELQRDVVRLRRYYQRNGYLHPTIDYPASQVDTSSNKIHLIFTIREGPPLIIQDVGFYGDDDSYVAEILAGPLRESWISFRDEVTLEAGKRYTDFEGVRLQDQVLSWFRNSGFAFATVRRDARVDSTANTVDLRFRIDPGPRGYIEEIQLEGNESVSDEVVLRELPFRVGDRFSAERLADGQRELFELNLFRVAVADVPEQPRDSTVVVRYRLREAQPRFVTAQTGYGLDQGALVQGSWTHRNFLGGARLLTISGTYSTGYGAAQVGGFGAAQQKSASLSLRQPFIFVRKLSGTFSPSYVRGQDDRLGIRFEELQMNSTLLYTIYNFRTVTFRHSISRATPLGETERFVLPDDLEFDDIREIDISTQNSFTLSANLGRVDDYFRPSRGFRIRPLAEIGGVIVQLKDDVDYYKLQTELVGYLPVGGGYSLTGRLFVGNIWPQGESALQFTDPQIEYRFDRIRYYAGGANDVRGWPADFLGPKLVRVDTTRDDQGNESVNFRLEPAGGLAKFSANLELRTPLPMLGSSWKGAVFLDMGQVFPAEAEEEVLRLRDVSPSDLRFGTGVGLRYETLVGFIRLDVGYKINPTIEDLGSPEEVYHWKYPDRDPTTDIRSIDDIETSIWDRFRLHLSLGQTF